MSESKSQFESGEYLPFSFIRLLIRQQGHTVPVSHQDLPAKQHEMEGPKPVDSEIPTEDGGYQKYKAAGKLEGKKAIITGGDSGIGRAIAILFAMEGADSFIVYLPEEEKDAQETKRKVEEHGRKCYLHATDLRPREACRKAVDEAVSKMGGVNILVNNAAYQMMVKDIADLSEYVPTVRLALSRNLTIVQRSMDSYLRH